MYKKLKSKISSLKKESEDFDELKFNEYDYKFRNYISDDLNTANAVTLLYDLLKSNVDNTTKIKLIEEWDKVLSLDLLDAKNIEVTDDIKLKIEQRNQAKSDKNYELADSIRSELLEMGIKLIDTRDGTMYEYVDNIK